MMVSVLDSVWAPLLAGAGSPPEPLRGQTDPGAAPGSSEGYPRLLEEPRGIRLLMIGNLHDLAYQNPWNLVA